MLKTKIDPPRQPGSNAREVSPNPPEGESYLVYTTPKGMRQEMKKKMKLVAALFCGMFFAILGVACWLWPAVLPWIMAPFAVAVAWKFCRVTYIWMTTAPEEKLW